MKAEISPDIKERIFQIDQKIDEYKRYIKELEEEKLSLQMEENRRDDEKPVVLEKLETEPVSLNRTNSAKEKAEFLLDFFLFS